MKQANENFICPICLRQVTVPSHVSVIARYGKQDQDWINTDLCSDCADEIIEFVHNLKGRIW